MVGKPRSSKSLSEDEFNAQLRAERAPKPVSHGMVMTHPPSGPSRSLEEVLREHELDVAVTDKTEQAPDPLENESKYQKIPVSLIDPNPLAPREVYTPQMILARAEALRTQGQHDPIHVIPNPDETGRFIICDGWTRVQACRDHQVMHELLAEVHEGMTLEQSAWFGYQQNEEREQHCDLDRAMFYEKLIAAGGTAAEVAKRAGLSKSLMTFYRSFGKLPGDVLEVVRTNPKKFGALASYQLSKVAERAGLRQAVRLAVRFSEEDHTYAWLASQAQAAMETKAQKTQSPSKHLRFQNGFYKQRGDCIEMTLKIADPSKRLKFAEQLEALIATAAEDDSTKEIGPEGWRSEV